MEKLIISEVNDYVNQHIVAFHNRRLAIISELSLTKLTNKNPYLFRAKNITKASELIEGTLEAFLSSSEEKLFGDFLEDLAIFVSSKTLGGHKSTAPGMDLEFNLDGIYHIVSIKSGPNWGNSSQHAKLALDFNNAERRLRQSSHIQLVRKVLGICYGRTKTSITRDGYLKIVGQNFWTLITGETDLYYEIIEPIGFKAREHNDKFNAERDRITNILTKQFIDQFCDETGLINWQELLQANSGNLDMEEYLIPKID